MLLLKCLYITRFDGSKNALRTEKVHDATNNCWILICPECQCFCYNNLTVKNRVPPRKSSCTFFRTFLTFLMVYFPENITKKYLYLWKFRLMKIDLAVGYEHHLKTTSSWLWMTYGFFDILEKWIFFRGMYHFVETSSTLATVISNPWPIGYWKYLKLVTNNNCIQHASPNVALKSCFSEELDMDERISFLLEEYQAAELAEIIVRFSTDHVRQVKTLNDKVEQLKHEIKLVNMLLMLCSWNF